MCCIRIIEDDDSVRDALMMFSGQSTNVRCYADAESFFADEPPTPEDIILVDMNLPGICGKAVIKWLANMMQKPTIVVISGLPSAELQKQLENLEVSHVLRKPLDIQTLQSIMSS